VPLVPDASSLAQRSIRSSLASSAGAAHEPPRSFSRRNLATGPALAFLADQVFRPVSALSKNVALTSWSFAIVTIGQR